MSSPGRHGVLIRSTARHAKTLSGIVSPTRSFEPTATRGQFFMAAPDEVLALRDAEFLTSMGVDVLALVSDGSEARP